MKIITATLVVLAGLVLGGCGQENNDAPKGTNDTAPADIIAFPNGFSNIAKKCDGPNMVYSSTNGGADAEAPRAAIAVAPNDPRCAK